MAITPGQTYSFTVYYRGEIDQAQSDISLYGGYALCGVFLQYYNSAGQALPSGGTWSCDTQRVWQRYAVSTTPPSGAAKARVLLLSYGMAGWAAFDDIEFKATNATTNLVTNGNFEGGTGGWTKKWVMTGNNAKAYPATGFTRDSTGIGAGRNGSNGYAIGNLATGYVVSSPVAVTSGKTYLIEAWLRGQLNEQAGQGDWRIRAQFYSSNGLDLGYQNGCYGFSDQTLTWAQAQCYVLPPQNAATMRLQLWLVQESGWVAFDDLTVDDQTVEVSPVDNLPNPVPPHVRQGADATNTYYFNGQRLAVRQGRALAYLHTDALGSTKLVTDQDGNVIQSATRYYAYGRTQTPGSIAGLPTDYAFTGQRQDNTGLIYMNAHYYDPEMGQFLSPDTLVPDASSLFDYNRYMYARGNPIKYTDPTGHYSQEALMKHFGCDNAQCISDHFGPNGDYAGLWGWFYILTQAHDGDSIYAHSITLAADGKTQLDDELRGTFATVSGKIMIQMASTANWNSNGGMNTTTFGPGALVSEKVGSVYGAMGAFGEYRVTGKTTAYANPSVKHANCSYDDCVGLALDGLSDAASAVAVGCTLAGQGECAAPAIAVGKGLTMLSVGYASYQTFVTGGSTGTDLVVTLATSGVSYFGSPVAGLFAGETQTFYDYNSLQRRP